MQIKLLQLNMWAGTHFSAIKDFLEKNDFDILCFQEVAGVGAASGNILSSREFFRQDCFQQLQRALGDGYAGELSISQYLASNPKTAYFGNAIFYKKSLTLLGKDILWLHKNNIPFSTETAGIEDIGRNALHLTLQNGTKSFHIVCTHLAWAPTKFEQPHQREQNLKLIEYIKALSKPWILTGDFNIAPSEQSILDLKKSGHDLTEEYGVNNTIDPMHRSWEKIKPGFPIDYIFVSPNIKVENFEVLENVHMSDHFGLTAIIRI